MGKRSFVYFTTAILLLTGLMYLISPTSLIMAGITSLNASTLSMIRSSGGLYIAVSTLIVLMGLKDERKAMMSITVIMGGFLLGRSFSLLLDGFSGKNMIVSFTVEILIFCIGMAIIWKDSRNNR
jgi:drug/metabolite transporter (DMT)-like permease